MLASLEGSGCTRRILLASICMLMAALTNAATKREIFDHGGQAEAGRERYEGLNNKK